MLVGNFWKEPERLEVPKFYFVGVTWIFCTPKRYRFWNNPLTDTDFINTLKRSHKKVPRKLLLWTFWGWALQEITKPLFNNLKVPRAPPVLFIWDSLRLQGFFPSIFTRASMSSHGRWHVITCWQISVTFRSRYSEIWSNDMVLSHETTGEVLNSRNIRKCINLSAPQRTFLHGVWYRYLCGKSLLRSIRLVPWRTIFTSIIN